MLEVPGKWHFCSAEYLLSEDRAREEIYQVQYEDDQREQMSSAPFFTVGAPLCPPTVTREVSTPWPEKRRVEGRVGKST